MPRRRRFQDNADFDQTQASALELLKKSDSFILFHFDSKEQRTEVLSAVAFNDIPFALDALDAQALKLAAKAALMILEKYDSDG